VIRQIEEFVLIRHEGYRQELHIGLLWRTVGFSVIAASAGSYDIGPNVYAPPRERLHMISREVVQGKLTTTVETDVLVAPE
jgi:hypothetical protein